MSVPRAAPPRDAPDLLTALAVLREEGMRVSAARRLVLEVLYAAEGPVTAEQIASGLRGRLPQSDLGSVYRNLDTLERAGLVCHTHTGHGPGRYSPAGATPRPSACCERCGTSVPLTPAGAEAVRAAVHEACGFEAGFVHFPLFGLCPRCAEPGAAA